MIRLKFIVILLLAVGFQAAGQAVAKAEPKLSMKEPHFDFGTIRQGRPVTHKFEVVNDSSDTLRIERVQTSCGCTTPIWTSDPIPPGKSSYVTVGYNAEAQGEFNKYVAIHYAQGKTLNFQIRGNVFAAPTTPAPPNASISLIKQ
jgi:hypothetical protein